MLENLCIEWMGLVSLIRNGGNECLTLTRSNPTCGDPISFPLGEKDPDVIVLPLDLRKDERERRLFDSLSRVNIRLSEESSFSDKNSESVLLVVRGGDGVHPYG